jgi:uncharacterized protein YjbJ (UPF0337 family)
MRDEGWGTRREEVKGIEAWFLGFSHISFLTMSYGHDENKFTPSSSPVPRPSSLRPGTPLALRAGTERAAIVGPLFRDFGRRESLMADLNKDLNKDLRDRGIENQAEGSAKELEGKVRNKLGDATDNESEQIKGKAKELGGKAQRKFGEAQEDLDDAV